jgi:hypothetical protein
MQNICIDVNAKYFSLKKAANNKSDSLHRQIARRTIFLRGKIA